MDSGKQNQASVISSASVTSIRIQCRVPELAGWGESPTEWQELLGWFDQTTFSRSRVSVFGLGIGSLVGVQLMRKGIGALDLVDHDVVMPSNLHRTYYFASDVGKHKAPALARNLSKVAVQSTLVRAFPVRAEEYLRKQADFDVAVCLVDDEGAREAVSRSLVTLGKPCIFGAASADGNSCRVVVQEPGKACYGCSGGFGGSQGCGPLPAIGDIQGVLASVVVYAVDTLLMRRPRHWNLRQFFLSGGDFARMVERDPNCSVCAGA